MLDIHLTKVAVYPRYFVLCPSCLSASLLLRAALLFSLSHCAISIVAGVNATSILDNIQEQYRFIFII